MCENADERQPHDHTAGKLDPGDQPLPRDAVDDDGGDPAAEDRRRHANEHQQRDGRSGPSPAVRPADERRHSQPVPGVGHEPAERKPSVGREPERRRDPRRLQVGARVFAERDEDDEHDHPDGDQHIADGEDVRQRQRAR